MCCLGFICRAEGLSPAQIIRRSVPSFVPAGVRRAFAPRLNETLVVEDGFDGPHRSVAIDALAINDSVTLTLAEKEERLKKLFEGIYDLEFVDSTASDAPSSQTRTPATPSETPQSALEVTATGS